jgi:hypothetical protein
MPAATWLKGIAALSRQVCMIRTGNSRFATGFLVGPRLVMTAAHTVSYLAGEREPMEAVFDDLSGDEAKWTVVGIRDVVASDPVNLEQPGDWFQTADFALLELASDLPDSDRGLRSWIDFGGHRSRLFPGEGVITLYHPGMMGLMVAQGAVANRSALTGRFGHNASTVPGASGAPVFDAKLKLIGMHESAFAGEAPNEKLNYAVRADAIARALEARDFKLPVPA